MTRSELSRVFEVITTHQNRQEPKQETTYGAYGAKPYRVGEMVEVIEVKRGTRGGQPWRETRRGKILQVFERFVTVDFGRYRECFWTDCDRNNTKIRRVSR